MMHALSRLIGEIVPYQTGETHAETTAEEALAAATVSVRIMRIFLSQRCGCWAFPRAMSAAI